MDHRNEEIRHKLQQRLIVDVVWERRERWKVKVTEEPESLVEKVNVGDRRMVAQGKTQEAVGRCFLMQGSLQYSHTLQVYKHTFSNTKLRTLFCLYLSIE